MVVIVAALMLGSVLVPVAGLSGAGAASAAPLPTASSSAPATASTAPISTPGSSGPHPGTLDVYEVAPGGAKTEDPSVAYDTVSYEPVINVYQTLVAYNGSSTTNFVPELATCVPGTVQCTALYGSSLITNNPSTGYPQYFTFVLDSAARFYDPGTGASWPVFPSDVMFTLARTTSFADLPGVGVQNGWIQTQALTPIGNPSWDGGIHYPYNNTPSNVLGSMLVNDSTYCPAAAMTSANGCITFDAAGSGTDWPFFLELVADPLGAGIEPCGFYTHVGAGVPGFTGAGPSSGDGPCLLPGGATSTSDSSYQHYLATVSPTAWDALQGLAASSPQNPQPAVQWTMVGSGPYYTQTINKAIGYVLKENPDYAAPTGCAGQPGCEPTPGTYQGTVNVYWDEDDSQGIANYQAGQADLAGIQLPAHTSTFVELNSSGKIKFLYVPELEIWFQTYNLDFNVTQVDDLPGNEGTTNVPGDFLSQLAIRQLLTEAYPYASINGSLLQAGGLRSGFGYGGAIPKYLGNYYAYNISWPDQDPGNDSSVLGSAAWWWSEANNASSPYYDPELTACTTHDPCTFPIVGEPGNAFLQGAIPDLIGEVEALTSQRIQPYTFDLGLNQSCSVTFGATSGCVIPPTWASGWAVDYPDPTDFTAPLYAPDATFTFGDSVAEQLALPQFNLASCPYSGNYSAPTSAWKALVYYHDLQVLPTGCQGIAYNLSNYWYDEAAPLALGPQRTLDYQMASQLDYLLALYLWNYQTEAPESFAPWISGSSLNVNPMTGGEGVNTWYTVGYGSTPATVRFNETGLPSGTQWSITVGGTAESTVRATLAVSLSPGTYDYDVGFVQGYLVSPANGTVVVSSVNRTVNISYVPFGTGPTAPLTFSADGLITGSATWSVLLTAPTPATATDPQGPGLVRTRAQSVTVELPLGTYAFAASSLSGYALEGGTGSVVLPASGASHTITYSPTFGFTYAVVFSATGLTTGVPWSAALGGVSQTTDTPGNLTFYVVNGTYSFDAMSLGWSTVRLNATVVVVGDSLAQGAVAQSRNVAFVRQTYSLTFMAAGLDGASVPWSVAVNGLNETAAAGTSALSFTYLNDTNATSNFTFVVTPPPQYSASPAAGTIAFTATPPTVLITFTSTLGTLVLTGIPAGAMVWVAGSLQPSCPSPAGSCSVAGLPAGLASIEVQASGYYTYFNNATVLGGTTTDVPISLTGVPGCAGCTTPLYPWGLVGWILFAIVIALALVVILLVAARGPGRRPPTRPASEAGTEPRLPPPSPPSG